MNCSNCRQRVEDGGHRVLVPDIHGPTVVVCPSLPTGSVTLQERRGADGVSLDLNRQLFTVAEGTRKFPPRRETGSAG